MHLGHFFNLKFLNICSLFKFFVFIFYLNWIINIFIIWASWSLQDTILFFKLLFQLSFVILLVSFENDILIILMVQCHGLIHLTLLHKLILLILWLLEIEGSHLSLDPLLTHVVESGLSVKLLLFAEGLVQVFRDLLALLWQLLLVLGHGAFIYIRNFLFSFDVFCVFLPFLVFKLLNAQLHLISQLIYLV